MSIAGPRGESSRLSLDQLVTSSEKKDSGSGQELEEIKSEIRENWSEIIALYNECLDDLGKVEFSTEIGTGLKILFPERASELGLDDKKFDYMKRMYDSRINGTDYVNAVDLAREIVTLYPDRAQDLDLEKYWPKIKEGYENCCEEGKLKDAVRMAISLPVLFPQRSEELVVSQLGETAKAHYLEDIVVAKNVNRQSLVYPMALLALFRENRSDNKLIDSIKLDLNKRHEVEKRIHPSNKRKIDPNDIMGAAMKWVSVINIAVVYKMLQAKDIKLTHKGIELTMDDEESFGDDIKPRPIRPAM